MQEQSQQTQMMTIRHYSHVSEYPNAFAYSESAPLKARLTRLLIISGGNGGCVLIHNINARVIKYV